MSKDIFAAASDVHRSVLLRTPSLPHERLITPRQLQCLAWVQRGKSASDIGGILGLSGRTVEKHLGKVCGHLGVRTRLQAVIRARELGLPLELGE